MEEVAIACKLWTCTAVITYSACAAAEHVGHSTVQYRKLSMLVTQVARSNAGARVSVS